MQPPLPRALASLASQSVAHSECNSCQAVNGIIPADGTGCSDHGTHVASSVGGLNYGVAKNVTLVPAYSCFKFRCSDGTYRCGRTSDIRANLECDAPRPRPRAHHSVPPLPLATFQPPVLARPQRRAALRPGCCRWVLTDCAAHPEARCVATQATHSVGTPVAPHWALSTLG